MNPSSSQLMAPLFSDYHQRNASLRSRILRNEEQRIQLEQKLQTLSNSTSSRPAQRNQVQYIQTYFKRLNHESQQAERRNLQLLNDLTQAQQRLDQLHTNAENLNQMKKEYVAYLESNYPNWQKPTLTNSSTNVAASDEYDRILQNIRQQQNQLDNEGNRRQMPIYRQSYDADSSMLFKHYENQLQGGLERTLSPTTPPVNNPIKEQQQQQQQQDEQSTSETNEALTSFSQNRRSGSLRIQLDRGGLYFLLDYVENELKDAIDKSKFYRLETPTISQERTIVDIANSKNMLALKDLDPTTMSMVILSQLPSTIRRTTINKCLLTEDILSANIQDLDKDIIAKMIPEQDRSLWLRLIDHFSRLLRLHIMNSQVLANKFAIALLPVNIQYTHDKAKSLLKYIVEKSASGHSSTSEDETSSDPNHNVQPLVQAKLALSSSPSWLKKIGDGSVLDDGDDSSVSSAIENNNKLSNPTPPLKAYKNASNDDHEFFDNT